MFYAFIIYIYLIDAFVRTHEKLWKGTHQTNIFRREVVGVDMFSLKATEFHDLL